MGRLTSGAGSETKTAKTGGVRSAGFLRDRFEKCAQRRRDRPEDTEQVEKDNDSLGVGPREFVTTNMREAGEWL